MTSKVLLYALSVCGFACANDSRADEELACITSEVVGECNAQASLEDGDLVLESDSPSCSVVEWTLDGERRTSLLIDSRLSIDGEAIQSRRDVRRRVRVQSCSVTLDTREPNLCAPLQSAHDQLVAQSPSDMASPSALRRLENFQQRYNRFMQRFAREAPIGCCIIDGMVCMTENGVSRQPIEEWGRGGHR